MFTRTVLAGAASTLLLIGTTFSTAAGTVNPTSHVEATPGSVVEIAQHFSYQQSELSATLDALTPYITQSDDALQFDHERAVRDGIPEKIIQSGDYFNLMSRAYSQSNKAEMSGLSLPVWGRYCGPGHSGPGAPIDLLDTACMHHDQCYGRGHDCPCNKALIIEIYRNFNRMGALEKTAAGGVAAYFAFANKFVC